MLRCSHRSLHRRFPPPAHLCRPFRLPSGSYLPKTLMLRSLRRHGHRRSPMLDSRLSLLRLTLALLHLRRSRTTLRLSFPELCQIHLTEGPPCIGTRGRNITDMSDIYWYTLLNKHFSVCVCSSALCHNPGTNSPAYRYFEV